MNTENPRSIGEILIQALIDAPGVLISAANKIKQEELESALVAHVRNQPHSETICTLCSPASVVKDCTKHDFGTCVTDCRYRTGYPGKCVKEKDFPYGHGDGNCKPDCYGRP